MILMIGFQFLFSLFSWFFNNWVFLDMKFWNCPGRRMSVHIHKDRMDEGGHMRLTSNVFIKLHQHTEHQMPLESRYLPKWTYLRHVRYFLFFLFHSALQLSSVRDLITTLVVDSLGHFPAIFSHGLTWTFYSGLAGKVQKMSEQLIQILAFSHTAPLENIRKLLEPQCMSESSNNCSTTLNGDAHLENLNLTLSKNP